MILQALHNTINAIITAYPLMGDIEAVVPFAVYANDQAAMYTKQGITGYENNVSINVVDNDAARCASNGGAIITAITALEGDVDGTTIDFSRMVQSSMRFDEKSQAYINFIQIKIFTQNV